MTETFDRNGRLVVVVKTSGKDSGSLFTPSGQTGNPFVQAGKAGISDDVDDASVFRSWAMPESELK